MSNLNLRQRRTNKYNVYLDNIWSKKIEEYKHNPILSKIDLNNIDNIDFTILDNPHFNYGNQIYNFYYFYKINKFVLGSEDENNDLELIDNFTEFFNTVKNIKIEKQKFYNLNYRRYLATYKIQQWWKPLFYNPNKKFIKNHMNNEYNKYINYYDNSNSNSNNSVNNLSSNKLKLINDF